MNDLESFINTILKLNTNDELTLNRTEFFNDKTIKEIIEKYMFEKNKWNNIYKLCIYIIKMKNEKLRTIKKLYNVIDIDCLIFNNLKSIDNDKIDHFCSLFINYLNYKINYKCLESYVRILQQIEESGYNFIWFVHNNNEIYTNSKYGEQFYKADLAERTFKIADIEYKLNKQGKKFFDNIYLEPTAKEKEIYSKEIDLKKMSTMDNVLNHKEYYEEVIQKIGNDENIIKAARLHDKLFKDFFEEYNVLIKYAITKYGENCEIKFCGKNTTNNIKYDGLIKIGNKEEKIEISSPFHGEEEKRQIKQLNMVGISNCKVVDYKNCNENIVSIIKKIIDKKNNMDSYDENINLVIMFDDFEFLFFEQIIDNQQMKSIFEGLKSDEYKFKTVSILIDEYIGDNVNIEAKIIKIK